MILQMDTRVDTLSNSGEIIDLTQSQSDSDSGR